MEKQIKYPLYFILATLFVILYAGCAKQNIAKMQQLPAKTEKDEFANLVNFSDDEFISWKLAYPVKIYDKNNIFSYIDGAAELYFAYDFEKVVTAEYQDGKTSILIDVYDMALPENAFGIYSLNKYDEANYVEIGNEGILTDATLDFWKDKYYCKIYSLNQSDEYKKSVADFGRKIASRIQESGEEPEIIKKLPLTGLVPKTEQFFTRKLGLDNVYFISDENVLELDGQTKGVMAEYRAGDKTFRLFIVEYPSPEKALSAFDTYSEYLAEKGEVAGKDPDGTKTAFKAENKYTYIRRMNQFISGFWDVESEELSRMALKYMK